MATIFANSALRRGRSAGLPALMLACAACSASADTPGASETSVENVAAQATQPRLGLMSTLPIYWNEAVRFSDLLAEGDTPNRVRAILEQGHVLEPLDVLTPATLAALDRLILAQPRALSPAENVALDDWVRGGGRAILFADPMLTRHSRYRLGDPRRPHEVALLSPILARWGLAMTFDTGQGEAERIVDAFGISLPVQLAGVLRPVEGGQAACSLSRTGLMAACRIGQGSVLIVADAALLDDEHTDHAGGGDSRDGPSGSRDRALERILDRGFTA